MAKRAIGVKAEVDVSSYNQGLRVYLSGLNQMVSATTAAVARVNGSANAITTGIAAAVGVTAVNAIQAFVRALGAIGQAAIEQVGFFERLAISLNFYAARAIQSARDGLGLADAMLATRDAAEDLMIWLQQLALSSPFTTRQVADSFRIAQAYGLSLDAARKLVPLILDFAAVNNLSDDILSRIALALGQIQARGKLAAQEINQLANAGVPVRDILVKGLGVTRAEFEKLLEEGLVPAAPALQIIVDYLQQFEGMAEKVTRGTLTGMISQFKDLQEIATRDLFGGISRVSIPVLNEISDFINQPRTFAALKELGNILGNQVKNGITFLRNGVAQLITTLINLPPATKQAIFVFITFGALLSGTAVIVGAFAIAVSLLVNQFTLLIAAGAGFAAAWVTNFMGIRTTLKAFESQIVTIFKSVTTTIGKFADFATDQIGDATAALATYSGDLADWGGNIMSGLAAGITGGVGIIVDALMALGDLFTFWLAPGSPPRLLPDLEKWGRETANVWLGAWRSADFGILQDLASDISGILKGLVAAGQLGEERPPRILIELRPLIAQAVDEFRRFGQISQESLNRMKNAAGPAGNAIIPLLQRYVALSAATDEVKAAQQRLTEITERYNKALQPVRDRLAEISELRETNDENREILALQRTIANVGVSASIKRSAQLRIQEILLGRQIDKVEKEQTAEEKAAQAALDAAEKRADAAEEALDAMKAQIDVQNTQLELYGEEARILEQIRKEQERLAKEALRKQREELEKQLEIVKLMQEELKDTVGLFKAQYTLQDANATAAEKAAAALEIQRITASRIVRDFEAVQLGIDPAEIEKIRNTLVTLEDIGIKGDVMSDFEDSLADAVESIDELSEKALEARRQVQEYFETLGRQWDSFLRQIDQSLPPFLRFRNEVTAANTSLSDNVRTVVASNEAFGKGPPILRSFASLIAGIAAAFTSTRLIAILTKLPVIIASLASGFNPVILAVSLFSAAWAGDWFDMRQKTSDAITFMQTKLNEFFASEAWGNIKERVETLGENISTLVSTILRVFRELFSGIRAIVESGFDSGIIQIVMQRWTLQVQLFAQQFNSLFTSTLPNAIAYFFTSLAGLIQKYWNPFTAILLLSLRSVIGVFSALLQPLAAGFRAILPSVLSQVSKLPGLILTAMSGGMKAAGRTLFDYLFNAAGGGSRFDTFRNFLAKSMSDDINAIIKILDGRALNSARANFAKGFQTAFGIATKAFDIFQTAINRFRFTSFFATFQANLQSVINLARNTGQPLVAAFAPVYAFLKTIVNFSEHAIHTLQRLASLRLTNIAQQLVSFTSILQNAFLNVFSSSFVATFRANIQSMLNLGRNTRSPLVAAFSPIFAFFKTLLDMTAQIRRNLLQLGAIKLINIAQAFQNIPQTIGASVRAFGTFLSTLRTLGGRLNITQGLQASLQATGKSLTTFLKQFTGFKGQLKLSGNLQSVFSAITGFLGGLGKGIGGGFNNVKSVFGIISQFNPAKFISGFKSVFGIVKNVSKAFGGFLNPLNLLIGAIDFFAFAFKTDIEGVENGAKGLVNNLKQFWADLISGKLWQDITAGFQKGFQFMSAIWVEFQKNGFDSPLLQKMLADLGTTIVTNLQNIGGRIWESITTFWLPVFGQWVRTSIEELGTQLGAILIFLRDWIIIAGTWIYTQITTVWIPAFTNWWNAGAGETLLTNLMAIVETVWGWITTTATFIYNELIASWVPAFFNWLVEVVPPLMEALGNLLLTMGAWIVTVALPWLIEKLLVWATAFIQWLGPVVKWTLENLGVWMGALVEWIIGVGLPWLVGTVISLAGALIGWINDPGPDGATTQIPAALGAFLKALVDFIIFYVVPGLWNAGVSIATGLWNGLKTAWGTFVETEAGAQFQKFIDSIVAWVVNVYNAGADIAKNLWDGLTWGITEYLQPAIDAVVGGAAAIGQAVKDFFGIASPSEWFRDEIGAPIVAGLLKGVEAIYNNPVFAAIHDAMVGGFEAVKEATIKQFTQLAEGSVEAVRTILTAIHEDITIFEGVVLRDFAIFAEKLMILLGATGLAGQMALAWLGIRTNTATETLAIYTNTLTHFTDLNTQLGLKMPIISTTVVGGFTAMKDAVLLEIGLMVTAIITALAGTGTAEDTTSLAALLNDAMARAGKAIGLTFVAGIAEGIKSTESLTILADAIYFIVKKAFDEANAQLETGSPSRRAARELGLPWSQGVAQGMLKGVAAISSAAATAANASLTSRLSSEFASRSGVAVPGYSSSSSSTKNYYLNVQSRQQSQGIIQDFSVMRSVDI